MRFGTKSILYILLFKRGSDIKVPINGLEWTFDYIEKKAKNRDDDTEGLIEEMKNDNYDDED